MIIGLVIFIGWIFAIFFGIKKEKARIASLKAIESTEEQQRANKYGELCKLALSDEKLSKLSDKELCKLLNDDLRCEYNLKELTKVERNPCLCPHKKAKEIFDKAKKEALPNEPASDSK